MGVPGPPRGPSGHDGNEGVGTCADGVEIEMTNDRERSDGREIGALARRGDALLERSPLPEYLHAHFARVEDAYCADSNPGGYIPLCIAENRLVWDLLEPKLRGPRDLPHGAICYDSMVGSLDFRQKLADFMGRRVLGRTFDADQIAVLAGAGSVLEILFYVLCDAGDGVLVPTPSYAGFWADLETRDELSIVPVHGSSADDFRITPAVLDRAVADADRPIRALLFTTPNNPLGTVYTEGELGEIRDWAERAGVHVVFDEIYALSVFGQQPFVSVATLRDQLGPFVHIVWAFSKDFGASGLRCGVLVSENERVIRSVDALAYWSCCSGHTQVLLSEMIADEAWVENYIPTMQGRLRDAYETVAAALREAGIPFLSASAGFFMVCDFREFLAEPTWEEEEALWNRLLNEANVNLTPGSACRNAEPGFLRLCFAGVSPEEAVVAVQRMRAVLIK